MLEIREFTVTKDVKVGLPMVLVAKKNGYTDATQNGEVVQFCEIGGQYSLIDIELTDSDVQFTMLTDDHDESVDHYLTPHYMSYAYLAEHFFVTF